MTRKKYQVFTPKNTVKDMLNYIGYIGPRIIGKRIIDLSCGDGAFLSLALERLINECKKQKLPESIIMELCNKSIYGIEIDERFYGECIKRLNGIIKREFNKRYIKWNNIYNSDGLAFSESGFDFVVGNPPYISYRDMSEQDRNRLKRDFKGCRLNKFDYSYAFVEKSLSILSDSGMGCIICPINMYRIKSGELIKNIIRPYISTIVDVSEDNIFPNTLTNPVISIFDKKEKHNTIILKKRHKKNRKLTRANFENEMTIIPAAGKRRFGDFFEVHSGVATLLNDAFIVDEETDIEESLLKNAFSPRFVRYKLRKKIIFPYEYQNGQIFRISEESLLYKYPKAYNHLSRFKSKLLKRKTPTSVLWYEYGRSQALNVVGIPKVMISAIMSEEVKPVLLGENDVVFAGLYVVAKDSIRHPIKEAFDILSNNKELYNYIKHSGVKMNGGSYRYGPKILEDYNY